MRPWRAARRWPAAVPLLACLAAAACGSSTSPSPPDPGPGPGPGPTPGPQPQPGNVLVGAGDIGQCGSTGMEETARLLDGIPGTVFTAGDNAYFDGSPRDFQDCYQPSWGRHKARTLPTPGNHDYNTAGAAGYFGYFGSNAGPSGLGYYAYSINGWRILALDSEIDVSASSPQVAWVRGELAANPSPCTLAIWHRPLFTSGPNGEQTDMRPLFRVLYDANVDVVVNGHDHLYERFAPMDPDGRANPQRGIREFVVGTGGFQLSPVGTRRPNSEVAQSVWGLLKLTLNSNAYSWEFIPSGAGARDTGSGSCH